MTGSTYHASRVRLVDHDEGVVFFSEVADLVHRSHVAVHREYTVGTDDAEALGLSLLQTLLKLSHVGVGITVALGLAQAHTVDDRGVVEGVGDDGVFLGEERAEETAVGVEAGGIEYGVLGMEVVADGSLKLLVDVLSTTDEANRRHTETATVHHLLGTLDEAGMVGQTEIVVGTKVKHFFALDLDGSTLGALDDAFFFVKACALEIFQSSAELFFDFTVHVCSRFSSC